MKSLTKKIILIIISIVIISMIIYLNTYYKASKKAIDSLKSTTSVKIKQDRDGILFDGPGTDNIFVFYPGGKVEYKAYSPLMRELAKEGLDTYIVEMPFNIAFLGSNSISKIKENYNYKSWYIGGHSLGGVVAATDTNKTKVDGLILLASYSTEKINCKTLSIYGTKDGVLNIENYNKNINNYKNLKEIKIKGGNHANFGNYGFQKGDNKSTITKSNQQQITIDEIIKFIND